MKAPSTCFFEEEVSSRGHPSPRSLFLCRDEPASVTRVNVPVSGDQSHQIEPVPVVAQQPPANLDRIERDLADVETALSRLDDGTYFLDEVTGEPMSDELLASNPLARRVG
jgi:hypothetical protein